MLGHFVRSLVYPILSSCWSSKIHVCYTTVQKHYKCGKKCLQAKKYACNHEHEYHYKQNNETRQCLSFNGQFSRKFVQHLYTDKVSLFCFIRTLVCPNILEDIQNLSNCRIFFQVPKYVGI